MKKTPIKGLFEVGKIAPKSLEITRKDWEWYSHGTHKQLDKVIQQFQELAWQELSYNIVFPLRKGSLFQDDIYIRPLAELWHQHDIGSKQALLLAILADAGHGTEISGTTHLVDKTDKQAHDKLKPDFTLETWTLYMFTQANNHRTPPKSAELNRIMLRDHISCKEDWD